jgi:hypothetical protein
MTSSCGVAFSWQDPCADANAPLHSFCPHALQLVSTVTGKQLLPLPCDQADAVIVGLQYEIWAYLTMANQWCVLAPPDPPIPQTPLIVPDAPEPILVDPKVKGARDQLKGSSNNGIGSDKWIEKHGVPPPPREEPDLVYEAGQCRLIISRWQPPCVPPPGSAEPCVGLPAPLFVVCKAYVTLDVSELKATTPEKPYVALWKCKDLHF